MTKSSRNKTMKLQQDFDQVLPNEIVKVAFATEMSREKVFQMVQKAQHGDSIEPESSKPR